MAHQASRITYASSRAKHENAAEHERPAPNPARSRKEAVVTIYDMIMSKAYEVQHMPQAEYGARFYVWKSKTLRVFLQAQDNLRVFAMAPINTHTIQPWEVVADHYLLTWGDEKPVFTHTQYTDFINQIKAASARLFRTRR